MLAAHSGVRGAGSVSAHRHVHVGLAEVCPRSLAAQPRLDLAGWERSASLIQCHVHRAVRPCAASPSHAAVSGLPAGSAGFQTTVSQRKWTILEHLKCTQEARKRTKTVACASRSCRGVPHSPGVEKQSRLGVPSRHSRPLSLKLLQGTHLALLKLGAGQPQAGRAQHAQHDRDCKGLPSILSRSSLEGASKLTWISRHSMAIIAPTRGSPGLLELAGGQVQAGLPGRPGGHSVAVDAQTPESPKGTEARARAGCSRRSKGVRLSGLSVLGVLPAPAGRLREVERLRAVLPVGQQR